MTSYYELKVLNVHYGLSKQYICTLIQLRVQKCLMATRTFLINQSHLRGISRRACPELGWTWRVSRWSRPSSLGYPREILSGIPCWMCPEWDRQPDNRRARSAHFCGTEVDFQRFSSRLQDATRELIARNRHRNSPNSTVRMR